MSPNLDGRCFKNQWPLTSSTKASRNSRKMVKRSRASSGKSSRRLEHFTDSSSSDVLVCGLFFCFCFHIDSVVKKEKKNYFVVAVILLISMKLLVDDDMYVQVKAYKLLSALILSLWS